LRPPKSAELGQARVRVGRVVERSETGWGICGSRPAVLAAPHPAARSQVYAGCVNLPALAATLPFEEGLEFVDRAELQIPRRSPCAFPDARKPCVTRSRAVGCSRGHSR